MNNPLMLPAGISFGHGRLLAVREKLKQYFPEASIQPFMLQCEAPLVNGENSIEFRLSKEDNTVKSPTQRLLNQNDAFAPVLVSLGVQKVIKLGNKSYPGNSPVYTYPAPIFDAAAPNPTSLTENQCIYGLYGGGELEYKADGKEIIYREAATKFMHYAANPQIAGSIAPTGDLDDMEQFCWIGKEFIFFGGNENIITLNTRGVDNSTVEGDPAATDTEFNQAVYRAIGWIIRGGADKVTHLDAVMANGVLSLN